MGSPQTSSVFTLFFDELERVQSERPAWIMTMEAGRFHLHKRRLMLHLLR